MHVYECYYIFVFPSGKYFDEISQDTGRYCFGVNDTLKSLEMGAVETLIVWENLEVTRYVLKDHSNECMFIPHSYSQGILDIAALSTVKYPFIRFISLLSDMAHLEFTSQTNL